jgi:hypothetical protein
MFFFFSRFFPCLARSLPRRSSLSFEYAELSLADGSSAVVEGRSVPQPPEVDGDGNAVEGAAGSVGGGASVKCGGDGDGGGGGSVG